MPVTMNMPAKPWPSTKPLPNKPFHTRPFAIQPSSHHRDDAYLRTKRKPLRGHAERDAID
jgi:hypothetical protein